VGNTAKPVVNKVNHVVVRESDNVSALYERSGGRDSRLVGLTWADAYQGVVTLPDSGIDEPGELEGRRLALPFISRQVDDVVDVRRAAASRGLHAAAALACLFSDEYSFVDVPVDGRETTPYAAETAALLRGEVDAIYLAGPAGQQVARRIGAVEVVDLGRHLDPAVRVNAMTPGVVSVDAALLEERFDEVARRLAELPCTVDLSAHKLAALASQKDFLLTHGFLADDVDLVSWVDPEPLAAARGLLSVRRR
jgi:ABC-type nitrate/sulfonate/bicarbonate transport system substrate-binding protein